MDVSGEERGRGVIDFVPRGGCISIGVCRDANGNRCEVGHLWKREIGWWYQQERGALSTTDLDAISAKLKELNAGGREGCNDKP